MIQIKNIPSNFSNKQFVKEANAIPLIVYTSLLQIPLRDPVSIILIKLGWDQIKGRSYVHPLIFVFCFFHYLNSFCPLAGFYTTIFVKLTPHNFIINYILCFIISLLPIKISLSGVCLRCSCMGENVLNL